MQPSSVPSSKPSVSLFPSSSPSTTCYTRSCTGGPSGNAPTVCCIGYDCSSNNASPGNCCINGNGAACNRPGVDAECCGNAVCCPTAAPTPTANQGTCQNNCNSSDQRLKENIHYVGKSPSGIPVYTFKYREEFSDVLEETVDTKSTYFGVMAQDLLDKVPGAVVLNPLDGYYRVDYAMIDVDFVKLF